MIDRLIRFSALLGLAVIALGLGRPPIAAQGDATPTAVAPSALEEMLGYAPDILTPSGEVPLQIATFADAATQLAAVGINPPEGDTPDEDAVRTWISAINWLIYPDFIAQRNQEWRAVFGFDLYQVDQALTVGEVPNEIVILRGRFDLGAIESTLTAAGYQTIDAASAVIYSLDPEPRIDVTSEIGRMALAKMNNVAILSDGTLVSASSLELIESAVATAEGTAPSLADRPEVQALVRAQDEPLVSAMLISGGALTGMAVDAEEIISGTPPSLDAVATRMAEISEMPPILLALLGTTVGGPLFSLGRDPDDAPAIDAVPAARFEINLLTTDPAAAETAVAVATARLETGRSSITDQPYSEFFATWTGESVAETSVARLELEFAEGVNPGTWLQMLFRRDLAFIAW